METFATKKKAEEQRRELQNWIGMTMGKSKWDELVRMEGEIRKKRKETVYAQRERRRKFIEILSIILVVITGLGIIAGLIMWLKSMQ
jgi:hypothetical protein